MMKMIKPSPSTRLEEKLQDLYDSISPDLDFVRQLRSQIVDRAREPQSASRMRAYLLPLAWGTVALLLMLALVWAINNLIPQPAPGTGYRVEMTPQVSLAPTSLQTDAQQATVESSSPDVSELVSTPDTPIPPQYIDPLITAPEVKFGLRFESWSPDNQWIAYWIGERDEGQPAQLAFVNTISYQTCQHVDVIAQDIWSGLILWQEDGRAIAVLNREGEMLGGHPCDAFAPVDNVALPDPYTEIDISPDGRYRAETRILKVEEQAFYKTTTITDLTTGNEVVALSYIGSPHTIGKSMWLNNEMYLIGKTVDQGIRHISLPDGRIGHVLPEILGLDVRDEENVSLVDGQADPDTGDYHLLLAEVKGSSGSRLLLYHSELDLVEELPYHNAYPFFEGSSFTPDGRWLLAGNHITNGEPGATNDYWLLPVDPPESTAVEIGRDLGFGGLSERTQRLAFFRNISILIYSFPDARLLSRWDTRGYVVDSMQWSPDGQQLAVMGLDRAKGEEALFVIQVTPQEQQFISTSPTPALPAITDLPENTGSEENPHPPAGLFSSTLAFRRVDLPGSTNPDSSIADVYADAYLLGRVDFGTWSGNYCDRSGDGGMIAFLYDKYGPGRNANPTLRWFSLEDVTKVYEPLPDFSLQSPASFSPRDYRLAFEACPSDGNCGLYIFDIGTGEVRRISGENTWHSPVWSPDGAQIAIQLPPDEERGNLNSIRVLRAEDGAVLYTGRADAPDSPLRNWGEVSPFEVQGMERCD